MASDEGGVASNAGFRDFAQAQQGIGATGHRCSRHVAIGQDQGAVAIDRNSAALDVYDTWPHLNARATEVTDYDAIGSCRFGISSFVARYRPTDCLIVGSTLLYRDG